MMAVSSIPKTSKGMMIWTLIRGSRICIEGEERGTVVTSTFTGSVRQRRRKQAPSRSMLEGALRIVSG
jgi:hypothetical protein